MSRGEKEDEESPPVSEKEYAGTSSPSSDNGYDPPRNDSIVIDGRKASVSQAAMMRNPLSGMTQEELYADVQAFAVEKDLEDIVEDLRRGALIAQDPKHFETMTDLREEDKVALRREKTHRWSQPWMMYFMTSEFSDHPIVLAAFS